MTISDQQPSSTTELQATESKLDWIGLIQRWKMSGMSQVAYCKANHINLNQFTYQRAKLSADTKAKSKLLPVNIVSNEPARPIDNNFVLHYPNGLRLYIPANAHPEAIKILLTCLRAGKC